MLNLIPSGSRKSAYVGLGLSGVVVGAVVEAVVGLVTALPSSYIK